jgi:hypothetical protein
MLSDLDEMTLVMAIADARRSVPLGETKRLDAKAVAEVIRTLRADLDAAQSGQHLLRAQLEREEWLRKCAETDAEREKRRRAEARSDAIEDCAKLIESSDPWEGHQAPGNAPTIDREPLFTLRDAMVERIRDLASESNSEGPNE